METRNCDVNEPKADGFVFFFKPQGYIFPPWSQPLSRAVNTKALSKGPGTERKA